MMQSFRRLFMPVLMVLAVLAAGQALAQEATPPAEPPSTTLNYNVPAQGEITDQAFTQVWTLETASADRLNLRVERTSGNLVPTIKLLNGSGQELTSGYDWARTYATTEIQNFTLPSGGTYQVQVGRDRDESGRTTGAYTLLVTPLATAVENPNNTLVIGEVGFDAPVTGEITPARWYQRYSFTAQGEDTIQVVARRTGGTLYPEVEILDANQASIQIGYTEYSGDVARIDRFDLPGPGTYTIAITRQSRFNGATAGTYELAVALLGAGPDNPVLRGAAGQVAYDTDLSGEINARWYQDWTLTATAGDTLTLTVRRTSGNLQPEVILLGGSGQELNHGYTEDSGDIASIERYSLERPGAYTVRVSRAQGENGYTAGAYTLRVSLDGAGEASPALTAPVGVIEKGTPVDGTITAAQWSQTWTFEGQAQQVVDIILQRTSGTLVPRLDIRDANGQSLYSGYYGDTYDSATIERYTLPGTGSYQIVAWRDGGQSGYTTGGYTLVVKPTGS